MTATTIRVQMAQRKDTAANWTAANPILLSGEIGYETDTKKFKIGNGSTNWNSLAYLPIPDGSGNLTITGNLEIGSTGSLTFEGSTADGFETTLDVTNPTADRTITLPNQSGTVLVSGNASIVDADIAANAEIAVSKLADGTARQLLQTDAAGTGVEWTSDVDVPGTLDVTSTATFDSIAQHPLGTAGAPTITFTGDNNTGIYSPGADQVAISTGGSGRLFVDTSGNVGIGITPTTRFHVFQAGSTQAGLIETNQSASVINFKSTGQSSGQPQVGCAASDMILNTNGSERLRIDSSGRLLVGTSSARTKWFNLTLTGPLIQAESGSNQMGVSSTYTANDSSGPIIALGKTRGSLYEVVSSGDDAGVITFQGGDGSEMVEAARITAQIDGTPGANDMPGRLVFSTTADGASSPTERMRISSTGKTNITAAAGVSEPAIAWENTVNSSGTYGSISLLGSNCNNTSSYHYIAATGLADKYYIYGNGTTGTPSDINLKKNIETTRDGYLEDLCRLRVVKYNWNEQTDDEPKELGVIAQELEQVFPGLVQQGPEREDGSSYKAVKTSVLPFMLLKALQEAVARIEILEAKVAVLESV